MTRLAPDGAEWAGTSKGEQETVFYRGVRPGAYQYAYGGDHWVNQRGAPICTPLIPIAEWLAHQEQQQNLLAVQACKVIEGEVARWNIDIDCSAAMRATVDAMIRAGYRK